jgi:hypothetical protein
MKLLTSARGTPIAVVVQPETGGGGFGLDEPIQLFAGQMSSPVTAAFAVNALAPAVASLNFGNLSVRAYDDTAEEGAVFELEVPAGATNMIMRVRGAADSAPGGAVNVLMRLYAYPIPNNSAPGPWGSPVALDTMAVPTNTNFQYYTTTKTLAAWGLVAGVTYQFELTRNSPDAGDTLSGNWDVLSVVVEFN